ncbi:MAG: YeeE/YedE family protein [bacterium]|nr:YeeE/YedE family protein [bacterium]
MTLTNFTVPPAPAELFPNGIAHYLIGGLLIGAGISLLFATTGRIGGASSVFTTTWSYVDRSPYFQQPNHVGSRSWRLVYAVGMVLGALLIGLTLTDVGALGTTSVPWWLLLVGGFVAGFGARLGGGCTSGHGVCGMASLNPTSFAAVGTFLLTAILTAHAVAWLGGAL